MKRDLGNTIVTSVTITPQTIGATGNTYVEGTGVDRLGYESVVFVLSTNKTAGVPTGLTITAKIQESSDNSTFTDITSASGTHVITNSATHVDVEIADATTTKRYIRGYVSGAYTGGTPITTVDGVLILGSPKNYPTTA